MSFLAPAWPERGCRTGGGLAFHRSDLSEIPGEGAF